MPFSNLADLLRRRASSLRLPSEVELPEPLAFLQRQPSLSLVVFRGAVEAEVHTWLGGHGWAPIASAPLRASFAVLSELTAHARKTEEKRWEVLKATYQVAGCTVLIDREMVVISREAELAELARATSSSIIAGLWERVSRSLVITEIGGGVRRSSWLGGARQAELAPWPEVTGSGPEEIVATFRACDWPVDAIFGADLPATVLLLAE